MKVFILCCLLASVFFGFPNQVTCDDDSSGGSSAGIIIGPIGTIVVLVLICYCCYRCCRRQTVIVEAPKTQATASSQAIQHFHIAAPVVPPQQQPMPQAYMPQPQPMPQAYMPQPQPMSPVQPPVQNPLPQDPYTNVHYDKVPNAPPPYGV